MFVEKLGSEEPLATLLTAEPVVEVMPPLMLQEVGSPGEAFVAN